MPRKHSKAHLAACKAARADDAYQIQQQHGYVRLADAYAHLPSVREYADRTPPGADPRIETPGKWVDGH